MGFLFTFFYQPVFNSLIFLMSIFSVENIFIGIFLIVFLAKILLINFSIKNNRIQKKLKQVAPEIERLKGSVKDKIQLMEKIKSVWKEHNINPFFPFLYIIVQIPIYITLFYILLDMGDISLNTNMFLYSFTPQIDINYFFLDFDLRSDTTFLIALIVGFSQYLTIRYTQSQTPATTSKEKKLQTILSVFLPVIIFIFSFFFSALIAIYWMAVSITTLLFDFFVNSFRKILKLE